MSEHIPSCAAGVPIFRMLPPSELQRIGRAMSHHHFRKGDVVAAAGSTLDHLYVVARGRLNVVHTTAGGREQVVRSIGPGEFMGEMALFYETILEGDIVAALETDACVLPRQAVQEVLHNPEASLRLVEEMAKRLSSAEQLIADLGLRDVGQRLAAELVRLAGDGREDEQGVTVTIPVPWARLAVKLGTTPETLSRRLGSLADQGLLRQLGGRTILIMDLAGLRRISQQ
ncbi:MAG: Crp/Fnr family transcriptional regulator [Bacillota bacterium]